MICWRLCKLKWAKTAFNGIGAADFPGRWNSAGTRMVYCADSLALAALEILVHVGDKSLLSRAHFVSFEVEIADDCIQAPSKLPMGWAKNQGAAGARLLGDTFVSEGTMPAMRVPSAVISPGSIYVLNPRHPDFAKITWKPPTPFQFDRRLGPKKASYLL